MGRLVILGAAFCVRLHKTGKVPVPRVAAQGQVSPFSVWVWPGRLGRWCHFGLDNAKKHADSVAWSDGFCKSAVGTIIGRTDGLGCCVACSDMPDVTFCPATGLMNAAGRGAMVRLAGIDERLCAEDLRDLLEQIKT